MKKKIGIGIVVMCLAIGLSFWIGLQVGASSAEPGSVGDPLITKSYLDARLADLGMGSGVVASSGYTRVTLSRNEILIGEAGTEMVLFSGSANSYSKSDGIVNLTVGELAQDGITLGIYSNYMCPDGRSGMKATSSAVVYVKGAYRISND